MAKKINQVSSFKFQVSSPKPEAPPKLVEVHPSTEEMVRKQEEILNLVRGLSELARHPARELRPFNCTQEDFDKLPGLVSRSTFLYWTGLSSEELTEEVKAQHIAIYKPNPNGKALYFKHEMSRLTGFKM